jgi:hypothetical protein
MFAVAVLRRCGLTPGAPRRTLRGSPTPVDEDTTSDDEGLQGVPYLDANRSSLLSTRNETRRMGFARLLLWPFQQPDAEAAGLRAGLSTRCRSRLVQSGPSITENLEHFALARGLRDRVLQAG